MSDEVQIGYWIVSFIDLLGQKDAILQADFVPGENDEEGRRRLLEALKGSVGVIQDLHRTLAHFDVGQKMAVAERDVTFAGLSESDRALAERVTSAEVKLERWSDGVTVACRLGESPQHFPISGVWQVMLATMSLSLVQLAKGRPVRCGLDVGTAAEIDGQLIGPAVVKAYVLESQRAKYPRAVWWVHLSMTICARRRTGAIQTSFRE